MNKGLQNSQRCHFPTMRLLLLVLALSYCITHVAHAQTGKIKNDLFWETRKKQPIYSQGGGIFKFTDPASKRKKYYWYGVHYAEADL